MGIESKTKPIELDLILSSEKKLDCLSTRLGHMATVVKELRENLKKLSDIQNSKK